MEQKQLDAMIAELLVEKGKTDSVTQKETLQETIEDLQRFRATLPGGSKDDRDTLLERITHIVQELEASHPTAASVLGSIANLLSGMGI